MTGDEIERIYAWILRQEAAKNQQVVGFAPCAITADDTMVISIQGGSWRLQAVNKADGNTVHALQQDNGPTNGN